MNSFRRISGVAVGREEFTRFRYSGSAAGLHPQEIRTTRLDGREVMLVFPVRTSSMA